MSDQHDNLEPRTPDDVVAVMAEKMTEIVHRQIQPLIGRIAELEARVAELERREREDRRP
jgi:hypothetical protein